MNICPTADPVSFSIENITFQFFIDDNNVTTLNVRGSHLSTDDLIDLLLSLDTKVDHLICKDCPNIEYIPIVHSTIALRYLYCSNCPSLKRIPEFNLLALLCPNCPLICFIPHFTYLEVLDCTSCQLIHTIPIFLYLRRIHCDVDIRIDNYPRLVEINGKWIGIRRALKAFFLLRTW